MQSRKFLKYRFFLVLLLCGVAATVALVVGSTTNVRAEGTGTSSENTLTVRYSLYTQRDIDKSSAEQDNEEVNLVWYEETVVEGGKLDEVALDKTLAAKKLIFEASGGFLNEKDRQKINNLKVTWYISDANKTKSLEELKANPFDFSTAIMEDYYLEGVIAPDAAETDTKWIFWAVLAVAIGIIVVGVIMAMIRNNATRLSLDNKRLMSEESKKKIQEIKSIEQRKGTYSPLDDGNDD